MAVRLNHGAEAHARSLIDAGKYDDDTAWSFSAEDGDKLLGTNGDDWVNYREHFLGEDDGPSNQKGTYHYPFAKEPNGNASGKVYGQALRAIRSRASQQGATDVFDAAGRLLDAAKGKGSDPDGDHGANSGMRQGAYYAMKAAGTRGEILLYQDIGQGGFFSEATSAEDFARDLKALGKVSTIDCRINSPGGNVFEGLTIYNLLASHPARVVTHVDGLAASIASVVAMAGDEIEIADNAMMMIHNAWGVGVGTADEIRKTAAVLDGVTETIARTYAKRSGTDYDRIRAMMDAETWMTAGEAMECGLADKVVDNMQAQACAFDPKVYRFKNAPQHLLAAAAAAPRSGAENPNRSRFSAQFGKLGTDRVRRQLAAQRAARAA